jgi:hypothetical protein
MRIAVLLIIVSLVVGGCGLPEATPTPPAPAVPPPTPLVVVVPSPTPVQGGLMPSEATPDLLTPAPPLPEGVVTVAPESDLDAIQVYLVDQLVALRQATAALRETGDRYYTQVGSPPDYPHAWQTDRATLIALVREGQTGWLAAGALYEQIEGIVAGVPSLARYNVILDTGSSGATDGPNVVPFDLNLPDGRVLVKPGNLFALTESLLWGRDPQFAAPGVRADFDGDGKQTLSEAIPDAIVLKGSLDALDDYTGQLLTLARDWRPTAADAFTILATMLPTVGNYFATWKTSTFVAGTATTQPQYQAASRLADAASMLESLRIVYAGVSAQVRAADPAQDRQLAEGLDSLHAFVVDLYQKEQAGKHYTPEEADLLEAEAADRATALTSQVTQVMALLGVTLQQGTSACSGSAPPPSPTP